MTRHTTVRDNLGNVIPQRVDDNFNTIGRYTSGTSEPPTAAELISVFGLATAYAQGSGFIGVAKGTTKVYLICSDGTNYFYEEMTVAS